MKFNFKGIISMAAISLVTHSAAALTLETPIEVATYRTIYGDGATKYDANGQIITRANEQKILSQYGSSVLWLDGVSSAKEYYETPFGLKSEIGGQLCFLMMPKNGKDCFILDANNRLNRESASASSYVAVVRLAQLGVVSKVYFEKPAMDNWSTLSFVLLNNGAHLSQFALSTLFFEEGKEMSIFLPEGLLFFTGMDLDSLKEKAKNENAYKGDGGGSLGLFKFQFIQQAIYNNLHKQ